MYWNVFKRNSYLFFFQTVKNPDSTHLQVVGCPFVEYYLTFPIDSHGYAHYDNMGCRVSKGGTQN